MGRSFVASDGSTLKVAHPLGFQTGEIARATARLETAGSTLSRISGDKSAANQNHSKSHF
jgi:hypothetical protein